MHDMKKTLIETLKTEMEKNEKIVVVDADLNANGTFDMKAHFPERHFNVGISEADAVGVSAGLSAYGFIPICGSFATFASRRVCDQVALSCCYARQNVKIIGSDPGVMAEYNGGTHMALEDVGVLRSIPELVILEPIDAVQLQQAVVSMLNYNGTVYLRLNRKSAEDVFEPGYKFDLFHADLIREGTDISLIVSGIMVAEAVKAAEALEEKGVHADVLAVHTLKPIDTEAIIKTASKTGRVLTCENHNVIGGLRSAVAETLCGTVNVKMDYIGVRDHFGEVGSKRALMEKFHMTAEDIVKKAETLMR